MTTRGNDVVDVARWRRAGELQMSRDFANHTLEWRRIRRRVGDVLVGRGGGGRGRRCSSQRRGHHRRAWRSLRRG